MRTLPLVLTHSLLLVGACGDDTADAGTAAGATVTVTATATATMTASPP